MSTELFLILSSIYKIADKCGLIKYIKELPEKTLNDIYDRLLKDRIVESQFLKNFFTPEIDKIFVKTLQRIAPKNKSIKRRFILAILIEPRVIEALHIFTEKKEMPNKKVLIPVFQRTLPNKDAKQVTDQFLNLFKDKLSEDEKLALRTLLNVPEKIDENQELLLEIRGLLKDYQLPVDVEAEFKISTGNSLLQTRNSLDEKESSNGWMKHGKMSIPIFLALSHGVVWVRQH